MTSQSSNQRVVSAALIIGLASLASRAVGLMRERALTTTFGAGDTFDAFVAAFRFPDIIFNLIVVGAMSAAFIPLFTEKLVNNERAKEDAFNFALSVLHFILLAVAVLSGIYALFANHLVPLITPGFDGEKLAETILLTRIMAIQPLLLSISFIFSGILNSFQRFVVYALAPILYNVGIIFGVIFFVPSIGIAGLGWGVVLGAAMHMIIQLPSVLKVGFRWRPIMNWSSQDIIKLRRMIIPRIFGLAGQQVNLLVVTIIGSTLAAGSITVFHLANNVQSLPVGVFGIAFAQAAFPTLAEQVARKQSKGFRETLTRSFRFILFFVVPLSAFFFLLRAQLIRVLFGAGQFDWEDTILTFETLGFLLISLFAQATIPLLTRAFYVRQNTIIPVSISIVGMVANVVLAIVLAPIYGIQGLALAFSISAIIHLVLLLAVLHDQLGGFNDRQVLISLAKISIAAILSGTVVQLLKYPVAALVDMQRLWGVAVQLVVTMSAGIIIYLIICLLLKSEELSAIKKYIPHKLKLKAGTETPRFSDLPE